MRLTELLLALGIACATLAGANSNALAAECSGTECTQQDDGGSGCHRTKSDPVTS